MKYETYKYEDGIVKLEFNFPCDEKLLENKEKFCKLLEKALSDLTNK